MRKHLAAFILLLFGWTQIVHAGPWTVGPQTISFSTTTTHTLGDGSNAHGGIPPAYAYMSADVASNFTESDWIHVGSTSSDFKGPGVGTEAKARFDCEYGFTAHDDPILNPGVIGGASHQHHFVGNRLDLLGVAAANATYASLRGAGYSGCYGGPINRTLYWEPTVYKTLTNGATPVEVKLYSFVSYYVGGLISPPAGSIYDPSKDVVWARGWRTISGFNMAHPTTWTMSGYAATNPTTDTLTAIVNAANAASHSGKYKLPPNPTGFLGWYCDPSNAGLTNNGIISTSPNQTVGDGHQPWLKNGDGTPTLNCGTGTGLIVADLITMPCWDGKNLDSPDGRGHMMTTLIDNDSGQEVCPEGWYKVPTFQAKVEFYETGQSDYTNWWLSSDRMPGMTQFRNGESMHFDLLPAWSYGTTASPDVFLRFMNHCAGVTIQLAAGDTPTTGDPHECNYAAFGSNERLWVNEAPPAGYSGSPNPVVNLSPDFTDNTKRYIRPPIGTAAPNAVHNKH